MDQKQNQNDSVFILKIILYIIVGSFWLRFEALTIAGIVLTIPLGLILGIYFASHDHFAIDRKIEYAVLIVSVIVSYFLPTGLVL